MENKTFDVTALGELLIDFTENGSSSQGNPTDGGQSWRSSMQRARHAGASWQKDRLSSAKSDKDMFGTQLKDCC